MKSRTVEGIVISRRNIGEADRLLNIYTREEGKIKVVARGSRRIKSKLACQIEPFCIGSFYLVSGKTFNILAGADTKYMTSFAEKDLEKFKDLSYVVEVLGHILPENIPFSSFYDQVIQILELLESKNEAKRKLILGYFNIQALKQSGYLSNLLTCVECGHDLLEQTHYQGGLEGIYCTKCGKRKNLKLSEYKLLKLMYQGKLTQIVSIIPSKDVQKFLEDKVDAAVKNLLEVNLKSKSL